MSATITYSEETALDRARELASKCDSAATVRERLLALAAELNIKSIRLQPCVAEGLVTKGEDGSYLIVVDESEPIHRRRFTIAHEMGHVVLEGVFPHIGETAGHGTKVSRTCVDSRKLERTVDRLASELLMPERLVYETMRRGFTREIQEFGFIGVQRALRGMATELGVSLTALIYRLIELPDVVANLAVVRPKSGVCRLFPSEGWSADPATKSLATMLAKELRDSERLLNGGIITLRSGPNEVDLRCEGWARGKKPNDEYWLVGMKLL